MKIQSAVAIALSLLFSSSTLLSAENEAPTSSKLKIGIIAPLTGGVATWGKSVLAAMDLANVDSKTPAELIYQDEETCSATKALTAYTFLRTVKKVDIIVASCLEGAQAIAPIALRDKIPFFISGRSSHEFQDKNPNALSWLSLLDYEGDAIARLILEKGWKSGKAMVWSGYFGVQFAQGIKNAIAQQKLPFQYEIIEQAQGVPPSGGEVQRLLRGNTEVVFLMMSEPDAAFIVKQLRELKYVGQIILQSSMLQTYDPGARASFKGALQQKFPADEARFTEIRKRIQAKSSDEIADDFVFSYDGFSALLSEAAFCATEKTSSLEKCLKSQMRDEKWREGASGKFRFMKDGSTERPMVFKTITEAGFN